MKNKKFIRVLISALSCLLLIGVAFGIAVAAEENNAATSVEIEYKNVSYAGAPALVFYAGTDAPLADNQKIKIFFWSKENINGIYNELTAESSKLADNVVEIDGKDYYAAIGDGVAPAELRKPVIVRPALIETANDGTEKVVALGETFKYSVFDYAIDMFAAEGGATDDQYSIYQALLEYAASIQTVLFTNKYNGVIKEKELEAAGGWADAYYVTRLNRCLYSSKTGKFEDCGDPIMYYNREPGEEIFFDNGFYYQSGTERYAFKGYRNADGSFLYPVIVGSGLASVTAKSTYLNGFTVTCDNVGVTEYNANYGVVTGAYVNYDDGKSLKDFSNNYTNFWSQYGITPGNYTKDKYESNVGVIKVYYYQPTSDAQKVEITHFYTSDGSLSTNIRDYHYAAIKKSDKTLAKTKITNASLYDFVDVDAENSFGVTCEEKTMYLQGYVDYVADPVKDSTRGNVAVLVKHIYQKDDPTKTAYTTVPDYGNANNGTFKTEGYLQSYGSINPTADGSKGSNKIGGAQINILNKSPQVVPSAENPAVNIFETDVYVQTEVIGSAAQLIISGASGSDLIKMNFKTNKDTYANGEFFLDVESGVGSGGGRYDAAGKSITSKVLAGSDGTNNTSAPLKLNTWYNLRIEYVAGTDNTATVRYYIDGELVSYISTETTAADDYISKVYFFHASACRNTYLYIDNTYISTEGVYEIEKEEEGGESDTPAVDVEFFDKVYTYGDGDYHGKGDNAEESAKMDSAADNPANGLSKITFDKEKLTDGTANTALHMLKNDTGGRTANYAAKDTGGNLYYAELDVKVIDSENKDSWMFKFSFSNSNIAGAGDAQEMATVCINVKEGYWTLSNMGTVFDDSLKFKLDQWHHLRFLLDPGKNKISVWVNDFDQPVVEYNYKEASGKPDTTYAGLRLNVRAGQGAGGKVACNYSDLYFDNIYTTTKYQDFIASGDNYASSDKYDSATELGTGANIVTDTDPATQVTNKYVNANNYTFITAPSHNRGHKYIYETDIKWLGATGFDATDATTAEVFAFKMFSETAEIFSIKGITTNVDGANLLLKVGTNTVATLLNNYWMNFRVVYEILENTIVEDSTIYNARYTVYINNVAVYTADIASEAELSNDTFKNVELTVASDEEGVVPTVHIDNTYTEAVYIDDYQQGDNFTSSNKHLNSENKDSETAVSGSYPENTTATIGSKHLFETDLKWVGGAGSISLVDANGNEVFKVYIIPDANDAGYAKLALENDIEKAFYTIRQNVWYNVQITAAEGVYTVAVRGHDRVSVEQALSETYAGGVVTAAEDGGIVIDNSYAYIENKDYSGNGLNKDNAFSSFIDAEKAGDITFDPTLKESTPNSEYTDAYITVAKGQITMGKKTAMSKNLLTFLGGGIGANHVFESDLEWFGSEYGVESGSHAPFFTITIKDGNGVAVLTIYAVGVYNVDTVASDVQFVKLFTSLEDVAADNYFAYAAAEVAFNLRVEYAESGEYKIFVNNNEAASGTGAACEAVSAIDVELGDDVYDTKITIKNTYIASK